MGVSFYYKNHNVPSSNNNIKIMRAVKTMIQLTDSTQFADSLGKTPGSSVGIATGYGLDGPGIESRWGRDVSHTSRPALRPTQPPVQWVPDLSRG
jgi:hypothetical protein